jgi:hypothetical protein
MRYHLVTVFGRTAENVLNSLITGNTVIAHESSRTTSEQLPPTPT